MSDTDLKPCPWPGCDGNADVKSDMPPFFVQCRTCECQGPHCETEDEARSAWNGFTEGVMEKALTEIATMTDFGEYEPAMVMRLKARKAIADHRALLSTSSRGETDGTSLAMTPASPPASDDRPSNDTMEAARRIVAHLEKYEPKTRHLDKDALTVTRAYLKAVEALTAFVLYHKRLNGASSHELLVGDWPEEKAMLANGEAALTDTAPGGDMRNAADGVDRGCFDRKEGSNE